jgi:hypothetical protein
MSGARSSIALAVFWITACAPSTDPMRYRLARSGAHWDVVAGDRVLDDLRPRYPEFFELVLDPSKTQEPNLLRLRDDLEHLPVERRNFDALNSIAIAYFELNYRAESVRGAGLGYMSQSFRSAKIVAVPWRAYGETEDPRLRDAILDFFEDAGSGEKLGSSSTAPRLVPIVSSLERKEQDPLRLQRIHDLVTALSAESSALD